VYLSLKLSPLCLFFFSDKLYLYHNVHAKNQKNTYSAPLSPFGFGPRIPMILKFSFFPNNHLHSLSG